MAEQRPPKNLESTIADTITVAHLEAALSLAAAWNVEYREHGAELLATIHTYVSQQSALLSEDAESLLCAIENYLMSLPFEELISSTLVAPHRNNSLPMPSSLRHPMRRYDHSMQVLGWVADPAFVRYEDARQSREREQQ